MTNAEMVELELGEEDWKRTRTGFLFRSVHLELAGARAGQQQGWEREREREQGRALEAKAEGKVREEG